MTPATVTASPLPQPTAYGRKPLAAVAAYYALACAITWTLAVPATLAFLRGEQPSPLAIAGAGLSAFGPLIAAVVQGRREGNVRDVFRVRTSSRWLWWALLALLATLALRIVAAAIASVFGFELSQWVYPPVASTAVAALVVFPLGEEFGWRGFAYPRLRERFGVVNASLIVGVMWSLWHLGYMVNTSTGELAWVEQLHSLIALPLYSVVMSYFFERARGSVAVAIGFHAAAHLNHIELAPLSEVGFHLTHLAVVAVAALLAARALKRGAQGSRIGQSADSS